MHAHAPALWWSRGSLHHRDRHRAWRALFSPASFATGRIAKTLAVTGEYQLYCPDPVETPIVLHVRAVATIAPAAPHPKGQFAVSGFKTEVTFPQGVASALAQMSPIWGSVTGTVLLVGANPHAETRGRVVRRRHPGQGSAAGFNFWVPKAGANLGTSPPAPSSSPWRRRAGSR